MKNLISLMAMTVLVSGCASQLKKDCESTNWFQHGESVAMRGEWLSSDPKLLSCRKEEAEISESQADQGFKSGRIKYCTKENSYLVGKSGDPFVPQFCEGSDVKTLTSSHTKGIRDYCAKSNGFTAGASGKKYRNLCPTDLESGFMPEYKKGRLRYVEAQIKNAEDRRRELDYKMRLAVMEVASAQNKVHMLRSQQSSLEAQRIFANDSNNQALKDDINNRISAADSNVRQAEWKVNDAERAKNSIQAEMDKLSKEISDYRTEMAGL
ncbi:DUF2799 domain-containing protein [Bdellovibrio sp. HCB274]|uniref:DUF2799 domain-containing protein n=1 Tax=Bdellovibrio sp. HCB274 TaxID=3394361 RepID=UPI0039B6541D